MMDDKVDKFSKWIRKDLEFYAECYPERKNQVEFLLKRLGGKDKINYRQKESDLVLQDLST